MSEISTRAVSQNDFDVVYDLYMDESINPYMHHDPMDKASFRSVFTDDLSKRGYSWVAEQNGQVLGMCFAIKGIARTSHVATITTLAVGKNAQGKGIGQRLVRDALQKLKEDGFRRIELFVEADNDKGINFYKKMGFQTDGLLPMYIKRNNESCYVDELLMSITYGANRHE
jgi:ribosomal protein S18 acetylase RimI-like enzyme